LVVNLITFRLVKDGRLKNFLWAFITTFYMGLLLGAANGYRTDGYVPVGKGSGQCSEIGRSGAEAVLESVSVGGPGAAVAGLARGRGAGVNSVAPVPGTSAA